METANEDPRDGGDTAHIGPFRIVRRLGAGGMAETFEGVRTGTGGFEQRVCVKRVLPGFAGDEDFARLFLREARIAAALSHRNITRVVELGEDRGVYYLALELVEGVDLRELLRAQPERRVPWEIAAAIGLEVAEALAHAHDRGGKTGPVVHRDVSPANVLCGLDGGVKLTDFGISRALGESPLTRSRLVRGNMWFMAPELLDGRSQGDARSDLFALGVTLYQCIAATRPYAARTEAAAVHALSTGDLIPLARVAPAEVPSTVIEVVERLLASDPDDRFQNARAVARALSTIAPLANARERLVDLVRAAHARKRPRLAAPLLAASPIRTAGLRSDAAAPDLGAAPRGEARPLEAPEIVVAPDVPPRWRPYAAAPRAWAAADRARAIRARVGSGARPADGVTASSAGVEPSGRPASGRPPSERPASATSAAQEAPAAPWAHAALRESALRRASSALVPHDEPVPPYPLAPAVQWLLILGALGGLGAAAFVLAWLVA